MKAVILSSDFGSNLSPLTYAYPKSMLPLLNKPVLEYLINFLSKNNIEEIFLIITSDIELFSSYFGSGEKYGILIHYIREFEPDGTAGCLRKVEKYLKGEPSFLLVHGGIVIDFNLNKLIQFHEDHAAAITVTVIRRHENPGPLEGLHISEGNLLGSFYRIHHSQDRRNYLCPCGLYLLDPCIFDLLGKDGYLDLKEQLIPQLRESFLPVFVREIEGYFSSINSIEDYYQVQRELLNGMNDGAENTRNLKERSESIWIGDHSHISSHSKLIGPVVIGDNCQVEEDSLIIGPTVIGNDCHISKGVMIRESIIWDRSVFLEGSRVETSIVGNGSSIKGNRVLRNSVIMSDGYRVNLPWHFKALEFKNGTKHETAFSFKLKDTLYDFFERVFDILLSLIILFLTSPFFLLIPLLIKMDSKGPVFFRQSRCGKNGKEFQMIKFRSMIPKAEVLEKDLQAQNDVDGPMFKMKNDPRITRVGGILRKLDLDELPQFINVLKGDMSIVGPRPLSMEEMKFNPLWRDLRLTVKPGITGQWQVSERSEGSFRNWIRYDMYYVKNRSIWLDVKIIYKTIGIVIKSIAS